MILIAKIGAAHGVKGHVKVKSYSEKYENLKIYKKLYDQNGKIYVVKNVKALKDDMGVVKFEGINDRNEAERLVNIELYIQRDKLSPTEEDEFYVSDLVGLEVIDEKKNEIIGTIINVPNFGAGSLLEIKPLDKSEPTWYLEFSQRNVSEINLQSKKAKIQMPEEIK